jgi:hemerythrin
MTITQLSQGIALVDIPEAGLSVLCGCPENAVKFLFRQGVIHKLEASGVRYESGPNAILLSEIPVQNGRFTNVAEFPVLQMLYRQGMIVPGHPGNTGRRPMIIGLAEQLAAQAAYIYYGNYGISDPRELCPEDPERGKALVRMKRWFSFGSFKESAELLELKALSGSIIELRNGVFLRRLGVNRYEFLYEGQSISVDLALPEQEGSCPYELPSVDIAREGFSVVHIGEGDGWDPERPCMSSLVMHKGAIYLIDAGPNIEESLSAVGLSVGCLKGIFHTHTHDDHFVGLTALMRSERRLRYYAVPAVRRSAQRKLKALSGVGEEDFGRLFELHDLEPGAWNDIDGMAVRPDYSPHPLETTIFRFVASGEDGQSYSYMHGADLSSFKVIDAMTTEDGEAPGISPREAAAAKALYLEVADLKKVDVGGGQIHGSAKDFASDASGELVLSHGISPAKVNALGFGRSAQFGEQRSFFGLAPDWHRQAAESSLRLYFPQVAQKELDILLAAPLRTLAKGEPLCQKGQALRDVYLSLGGKLERSDTGAGRLLSLRAGALLNALECSRGQDVALSFHATQRTEILAIPADAFLAFVRRNGLAADFERVDEVFGLLSSCPVFSGLEFLSAFVALARAAVELRLAPGERLDPKGGYAVVAEGTLAVFGGPTLVELIGPGDGFGEDGLWGEGDARFRARAFEELRVYILPRESLMDKPLVLWRLRERFERRVASAKTRLDLSWRPEYDLGLCDIDAAHNALFLAMEALLDAAVDSAAGLASLKDKTRRHFSEEELLMMESGYPRTEGHALEHESMLALIEEAGARLSSGDEREALVHGLKDALIRHTLVADRLYLPWLRDPARR